jgi:hypothetical protein
MTASESTIELLTVSEAARRIGAVRNTLARQIERSGVKPDAILIEGGKHLRSPLFVESRLPSLAKLVESKIH